MNYFRPLSIDQDSDEPLTFVLDGEYVDGVVTAPSPELLRRAILATDCCREKIGELETNAPVDRVVAAVNRVLEYFDVDGFPSSCLRSARGQLEDVSAEYTYLSDEEVAWADSELREWLAEEARTTKNPWRCPSYTTLRDEAHAVSRHAHERRLNQVLAAIAKRREGATA